MSAIFPPVEACKNILLAILLIGGRYAPFRDLIALIRTPTPGKYPRCSAHVTTKTAQVTGVVRASLGNRRHHDGLDSGVISVKVIAAG